MKMDLNAPILTLKSCYLFVRSFRLLEQIYGSDDLHKFLERSRCVTRDTATTEIRKPNTQVLQRLLNMQIWRKKQNMDLHVLNVEGVEDFRSQKMNPMKMTYTGTDDDVTYSCVLVLFPGNISSERLVLSRLSPQLPETPTRALLITCKRTHTLNTTHRSS